MLRTIVGINWGDEGKGRMVDLLSSGCKAVVRYQGGNNAGHTVVNERGRFVLNLLPSGILREGVVNVMGPGMVIDLEHLWGEIIRLREAGVAVTPENLKISDRAVICPPYDRQQDILEEERLGAAAYGSTRRGIAPVYGDKYLKKALRMGELDDPDALSRRLQDIVRWKSLTFTGVYGAPPLTPQPVWEWLMHFGQPLLPFVCDTGRYLDELARRGEDILFEAQLGALRDIDYGIYPYTSSSSTLAAYAPIGAGVPGRQLDRVIGVLKAYSTCVGEGPFPVELLGEAGDALRQSGGEYGAATGRPRRVGPFDAVASRYGVRVQGAHELALTKLDVLSDLAEIPVCTAYRIDGRETADFPMGSALDRAEPVYTALPGWNRPIGHCRHLEELPPQAIAYVDFIERLVGCPITYLSVGPEREQYIERGRS